MCVTEFNNNMFLWQKSGRNSIIGDEYRWPKVIPYYLEDDLGEHLQSETYTGLCLYTQLKSSVSVRSLKHVLKKSCSLRLNLIKNAVKT